MDSVHGTIELSAVEWQVVNTASFQRLRFLKQLGMSHLVYPNATHNRFAHSLGVLGIMIRLTGLMKDQLPQGSYPDLDNLRLAALLHDIGHYPYSHLMETVGREPLTEEACGVTKPPPAAQAQPYPKHEKLGEFILLNQSDLVEAVGGPARAKQIGELFTRSQAADSQITKLIHSTLDLDRIDYLVRDSRAAGVPYGEIDIDYLLNSLRFSDSGTLGIEAKATAAAEHFVLARQFMYRIVYYHKTSSGFDEACRQLLRRARDKGLYGVLADGDAVFKTCAGPDLLTFTDAYIDGIVQKAASDTVTKDQVIRQLAQAIATRRRPRLLWEEAGWFPCEDENDPAPFFFKNWCQEKLPDIAQRHGIELGLFLMSGNLNKPVVIEERPAKLSKGASSALPPDEWEELINVFPPNDGAAKPLVERRNTLVYKLGDLHYLFQRLYLVDVAPATSSTADAIAAIVRNWR